VSSDLPISSPYRSTPEVPVSEAERNQVNSRLNAAFEAGRLDSEDYQARLDRLFAAGTLGELVPVVEGLPPLQTYAEPAIVHGPTAGRPGELTAARDARGPALLVVGGLVAAVVLIAVLLLLAL